MTRDNHDDRARLPGLYARLTETLRAQETELAAVTEAMRAQRTRFVGGRGDDLLAAHRELEEKTAHCVKLDRERLAIMQEIAAFLGTDVRRLRASDLASVVTGHAGRDLVTQAHRTRAAAENLQVESRVGGSLLAWSARCHEGLLRRLAQAAAGVPTYDRNGKKGKESGASRLVDAVL